MRFELPPLPSPWPARRRAVVKGAAIGAAWCGLIAASYAVPAMLVSFLGLAIALDRVKPAHIKAALLWIALVVSIAAFDFPGLPVLLRYLSPPGLILAAVAAYRLIYTNERS
jgi:hypothetical protein